MAHRERVITDDGGLTDNLRGAVDDGKRYGRRRRVAAEFIARTETVCDPAHPRYGETVERSYIHDRRAGRNRERVVNRDGVNVAPLKDVNLREKNRANSRGAEQPATPPGE